MVNNYEKVSHNAILSKTVFAENLVVSIIELKK